MTFISNTPKRCFMPCAEETIEEGRCSCHNTSTRFNIIPTLESLNFRDLRKNKGFTLRKVEDLTGISNAYLSQLENGKIKSPSYTIVKTLYDLYNMEK